MTDTASTTLGQFQSKIGYAFSNIELLQRALTHSSFGDGRQEVRDNERLEFLGDRVLGLLAARFLFDDQHRFEEGDMAPRLNALVRKEACARAAKLAGVGEVLLLSKAEDRASGRDKTSILGDACEALLAALYLDGGMEAAKAFFDRYWQDDLENAHLSRTDAKSKLQEWAQGHGHGLPIYTLLERTGPDHAPKFLIEVKAGSHTAQGRAHNKQEAERLAASSLLKTREKHE